MGLKEGKWGKIRGKEAKWGRGENGINWGWRGKKLVGEMRGVILEGDKMEGKGSVKLGGIKWGVGVQNWGEGGRNEWDEMGG